MNLSFQEKSTWATLFSLIAAYGYYFYKVYATPISSAETITLFIMAVVFIVVTQIVFHILIALSNTDEAQQGRDERDVLIGLRATRISSAVLATGVLIAASLWLTNATPLHMANAILLALVVSELVQCVIQLAYYRMEA